MLRTRIITALALLSAFSLALFCFPPIGWVAFATLVAVVAAWEWGGLMALSAALRAGFGIGALVICGALVASNPMAFGLGDGLPEASWRLGRWFYWPAVFFWLLVAPVWMKYRWVLPKSGLGLVVGLVVIMPAWLALIQLKHSGGELAIVAIMATVWLADSSAYAFGRTLGRHKLAPSISPGKTWEGAVGGGASVIVYGFVLMSCLPSAWTDRKVLMFSTLLLVSIISVVGDLFESLLKRQVGLKDSSHILPGHGGVLDRIDSLTSTLPLVALVWLGMAY